jgi:transposase
MSTSLLYHVFGIRGYKYLRTKYTAGAAIFTIEQERQRLRCAECGVARIIRRGQIMRKFRALPIGGKPVQIVLGIQRVFCLNCWSLRQVKVDFADCRRTYTKAFERYALDLLHYMTILDVARHLGVSWDVIKDIQKRHLQRHFSRPKLKHLRFLAIDEIYIGKRLRYLTVVLDLQSGQVVYVGEGKGTEALLPFWKRLRRSRAKIEAVAMDMSPAYISAVTAHLKGAAIVFDHFHVIKLFNEKLSKLRRDLYREATDGLQKEILKGTRWLLLKNPENLDQHRNEAERLHEALQLNQPLATAYYMKEDLRLLWDQPNKATAKRQMTAWVAKARASGIQMLKKFANTLLAHRSGILAYYDFLITTAPLEGTNNKIKIMKNQAYGFRDVEFFKLKIMAIGGGPHRLDSLNM